MSVNEYDYVILYDRIYSYEGDKITIGGIQTYLIELALLIQGMGRTVIILQRGFSNFRQEYRGIEFISYNQKIGSLVSFRALASEASKFVKSKGIVIWGNDQTSVKIPDIKTISIQHGITFDIEGIESKIKRKLINTPFYSLYRCAQRLNAIRKFEQSDYHVCVDYNFVNWYRTYRNNKQLSKTRVITNFSPVFDQQPEKNNARLSVVFARRFVERRGVHLFRTVVKRINSERKDIDFYIAGEGPYKQQLELDFGECDNVYFSTFRPEDSLDFHKNKDIAIVCSIGSEGTSLSLLEGMAAGCAVVSTNVGGLTNIVIDQHNGLLCEPNADSLYGALISLIDDEIKRKKLALNAYNTVIDSFNITKWRREWSDMLLFVENKS
ncbi:glycosyltransferase family 4 protein [Enterobacter hormaechei]|uniref:glycosyltransferase family 4 protein n=1 Tax=Enterobacter hormaechei TaxID=158836 RepID=UPI000735D8E6|nr:glycosyltransferase family 4 protein [Enterobacter hormaechei]CAE7611113.1 O-antigen biosynthesis glycosyltransferase WbnH [Enterobacter cloacae]EKY3878400.1 glycosyltransferase family 4 protein [Enterobacter hormaechei]ELC0816604.1 glycosyltransferase family 4 protein [Enterobacter hormaechei]KTH50203.1 hypothetical protein ASV23_08020 [Enterobacter hormaechei subsp. steigerwaltii]KVJ59108.1 hypothetical protein AWS28_22165 [Enterobacter hormaechei subsp. steigerwaltii]